MSDEPYVVVPLTLEQRIERLEDQNARLIPLLDTLFTTIGGEVFGPAFVKALER